MTRPRLYKIEGVVLRAVPVGEADRIVTLYTRDRGKLRASARGVRRGRSKLGGHLDVLNRVSISLARGRNLDVITGADALETFRRLKSNLDYLAYGLYVAELVDAISPQEAPNYPLFALTLEALRLLEVIVNPRPVLHAFELRVLEYTGFMPELNNCVVCRTELEPGQHRYAPEVGGALCLHCSPGRGKVLPLSVNALKALRFLADRSMGETQRLGLPLEVDDEVTVLLASSIHNVLEADVRTASLIAHLRSLKEGVMGRTP